jgi:hypothetical protein
MIASFRFSVKSVSSIINGQPLHCIEVPRRSLADWCVRLHLLLESLLEVCVVVDTDSPAVKLSLGNRNPARVVDSVHEIVLAQEANRRILTSMRSTTAMGMLVLVTLTCMTM